MTIKELIPVYLAHLRITGRAERTIKNTRYSLNDFVRFLDGEEILNIEDITAEVMLAYQEDLAFRLTAGGKLFGDPFAGQAVIRCPWLCPVCP